VNTLDTEKSSADGAGLAARQPGHGLRGLDGAHPRAGGQIRRIGVGRARNASHRAPARRSDPASAGRRPAAPA
jgi:hypothetical protein